MFSVILQHAEDQKPLQGLYHVGMLPTLHTFSMQMISFYFSKLTQIAINNLGHCSISLLLSQVFIEVLKSLSLFLAQIHQGRLKDSLLVVWQLRYNKGLESTLEPT